ncbi:MAG TPA: family 43 glycosylhydrolase, partial [Chitinispirillaceae bacterium]|nr:family 43 glycosylhydrolase [Chitinispirillaceae bacterium]
MKPLFFFTILLLHSAGYGAWDSPDNGNPVLPGYTADPAIMFDSVSSTFFIYSTTDGVWIDFSSDPQVAYSKDFINWQFAPLELPAFWPKTKLWAPSAIRHPASGKYYLMYCIVNAAYIAFSSSPFGPWTNAVTGNNPLYKSGDLTGNTDWIDPQFFIDTTTVYMTFGQSSNMGIARLSFNQTSNLVTIDGTDPRMTDGVKYKCKRLSGLSGNLEGSCMFKRNSRYFITYSNSACQYYNVRYAVASSPAGPFTFINKIIVGRDNQNNILGPGHNSILHYGNNWYICYHRQHYQYIDVKRQTCIDQITFNGDTISALSQTQMGVWAGSGSLETLVNDSRAVRENDLAFGKSVVASSESAYKGGTSNNQNETFASIDKFYKAQYAVDRNNGTRWAPSSLPGYLIVDLDADYPVTRCETTFELIMRTYRYRIEYLAQTDAPDINAAQKSTSWYTFADCSNNSRNVSPVIDSNRVKARYLKLTLLSANIPTASQEISTILQTDYADRLGVFEFKVFADVSTDNKTFLPAIKNGHSSRSEFFYKVNTPGIVEIHVSDLTGRVILHQSERKQPGWWNFSLNGFTMPPGLYIIKVKTADIQVKHSVNYYYSLQ